jgi:hypothetical protein
MKLGDPDVYVQWTRCEDPGENPKWDSQCGLIEQIGFGNNPLFRGFVGPEKILILPHKSTFASIKQAVEAEYQKTHELAWAYDDD